MPDDKDTQHGRVTELENKMFAWVERKYDSEDVFTMGPYFTPDAERIGGRDVIHSADDLLRMGVSNTLAKRIEKCKQGTVLKVNTDCPCRGDTICIKCLSEEDLDAIHVYTNCLTLYHPSILLY